MKTNKFIKSSLIVGICTGTSRLFGLIRNILMAHLFGTSALGSAFVLAFRIPNLFRRLFGEGALSAAFIPVFSEAYEKDKKSAWKLASTILTLLTVFLSLIVVVVMLVCLLVINAATLPEVWQLTFKLLLVMFPYMLFICIAALFMAILNSRYHFFFPAFAHILLNIIWIAALLFLCPQFADDKIAQVYTVAFAVLIGGIAQMAIQLPVLFKQGFRFTINFDTKDPRVRKVIRLTIPAAIGMGVIQLNTFLDDILATCVGDWAPAALSYAYLLVYMPLGIIATAMGTVLLPVYSRQSTELTTEKALRTLNKSSRMLFLIMPAAAVGLTILAPIIVQTLFQWTNGQFTDESLTQTYRALMFYAPGLIVFGWYKVLAPFFYAYKDTKTPMKVAMFSVALNLILNITFILTWPDGYKHAGLACSTVISSTFNCIILAYLINKRYGSPNWKNILAVLVKSFVAAAIMAIAIKIVQPIVFSTFSKIIVYQKLSEIASLTLTIAIGIVIYLIVSACLNHNELKSLRRK
ncbi:MAG: murein biosynthesis integral membrane protein MurJ [Kiritimatiellae bacterium]|jgi:putative peptidoglycan lipid II flippase|nr:murein biosynthesis integral membrane protein MurJ [Kiritimatiellia bacterium]